MMKIGSGSIAFVNGLSIGGGRVSTAQTAAQPAAVESGSKILNEDGSSDAILFENEDNWVTE